MRYFARNTIHAWDGSRGLPRASLVAGQDADARHPHRAGDMPQNHVSTFEPTGKSREANLPNRARKLDSVFLSHVTQCMCQRVRALPLKLAFFNKLSY